MSDPATAATGKAPCDVLFFTSYACINLPGFDYGALAFTRSISFLQSHHSIDSMSIPTTTGDAPKIDDANVLLNVYVPLLIVATSIIYYAAKRSLDQKEVRHGGKTILSIRNACMT